MTDRTGIGTFINDEEELASHGLDLFSKPPVDLSLIHGKTVTYYPTGAILDNNPIEFVIPQDGNDYCYLPLTRLEGCLEVVKTDGTVVGDTELNAFANLFPSTIFRQVECEINNTQICDLSTPTYPYKSYIETHLSFGNDAKKTHLKCELYEKEEAGKEETYTIDDAGNKRFKNSHTLIKGGKFYFSSLLHIDLFHSQKFLIPGCTIKLKFIRHEDKFSLLGTTLKTKIKLHDLRLSTRKITVDPQIAESHENMLTKQPVVYNIVQSKIKTFLLTAGIKSERITNIFRGKLPRSMIVTFLHANAFDGDIARNPFKFQHYDMNYLQVYVNGEPLVPRVFQPNFETNEFVREYRWFLDNIGVCHGDETPGITMEDFKNNSFFMPFDFSPDLCNNFHSHGSLQGTIDIHFGFSKVLPNNVTCLIYSSFNEAVVIDKDRQVSLT